MKNGMASIIWRVFVVLLIPIIWLFNSSKVFWEFVEYAGAGIVTLGVIGEYLKEFKEFPSDESARKKFAEWSVIVLILGLVIELLGLVRTSQISGMEIASLELTNTRLQTQIAQTGTNVAEIDWRRHPPYSFEASATLFVTPIELPITGFENIPNAPWYPPAPSGPGFLPYSPKREINQTMLYFGFSQEMAAGDFVVGRQAMVMSDDVERSLAAVIESNKPVLRFDIHFKANASDSANSLKVPYDFDAINLIVPIRCEVLWGEVKMSFNNDLTNRIFQIPKQTTFVHAATSVSTNGVFVPIDFSPKVRTENEPK